LQEFGHNRLIAFKRVYLRALSLARQRLVRPGSAALEYFSGKRKKHFGSFAFLAIVVALRTALIAHIGIPVVTTDKSIAIAGVLQKRANPTYFVQMPTLVACCRGICAHYRIKSAEHLVPSSCTGSLRFLRYRLIAVPILDGIKQHGRSDRMIFAAHDSVTPDAGPKPAAYFFYTDLPVRPL
jgi:hypothetical protein